MSDVEKKLLNETRRKIISYRATKEDNMFDIFFRSHLDFMEKCITFYEESFKPEGIPQEVVYTYHL